MTGYQELEAELARVRGLLIERDRQETAARADALARRQAAEAAADLATQAEARAKEVAAIRQGAWLSHLIQEQQNKAAPLDLAALAARIPGDGSWPPGTSENTFNIGSGAVVQSADVKNTFLGRLRGSKCND